MELIHIAVFTAAAIPFAFLPGKWRAWALFLVSVIAIFWLQPTLDVRWLDYSLPVVTLAITAVCWWLTRDRGNPAKNQPPAPASSARENIVALVIMFVIALLLTVPRYVDLPIASEIISRPPPVETVVIGLALALIVGFGVGRVRARTAMWIAIGAIVVLLIVLKTAPLTTALASLLRTQTGQDTALAKAADLGWLGFSYVAFRLIHTLRDRQMGILPALTLREYVTYVIFFPAYTSGPIDRAENFTPQIQALTSLNTRDPGRITQAVTRILIGMIKKFAIADLLAVISLNATTAHQAGSALALWGMLYVYAFRLFFDFSGYTDIAIGIGMLFGLQLPENFNRPYAKTNITTFWQSWHATLSAWARAYVYSPLSRSMIKGKRVSGDMNVLLSNLATMIVIGLWHGVTLPFVLWGIWHAIGLTAHKLWSDRTKTWYRGLKDKPGLLRAWSIAGTLITFHFVLLGWVWFALPDLGTVFYTFGRLFGIGG